MLKLFIYGYLNRVQSSRRLEQEANRNVELMWLLGRLAPDFKTIADFRKNNGEVTKTKTARLENKIAVLKEKIQTLKKLEVRMDAGDSGPTNLTD